MISQINCTHRLSWPLAATTRLKMHGRDSQCVLAHITASSCLEFSSTCNIKTISIRNLCSTFCLLTSTKESFSCQITQWFLWYICISESFNPTICWRSMKHISDKAFIHSLDFILCSAQQSKMIQVTPSITNSKRDNPFKTPASFYFFQFAI